MDAVLTDEAIAWAHPFLRKSKTDPRHISWDVPSGKRLQKTMENHHAINK